MRLPTLFKQRSPKAFDYKPRYYDERKERLDALMKSKQERTDQDYFEGYRRKSYRDDWKTVRKVKSDQNSRMRLVVIFILLLLFAWYALKQINLETLI